MVLMAMFAHCLSAQDRGYFIGFTNKQNTPFQISKPQQYLSVRAIERRIKQRIGIDSTDIPVNKTYVDSLKKLGINVMHTSKWMNGVIAYSNNATLMDTLVKISFVKEVEHTKGHTIGYFTPKLASSPNNNLKNYSTSHYGEAYLQIKTVNGDALHQEGYTGRGMQIAVLDAGFLNADKLPLLQHLFTGGQILGYKDFVDNITNIFEQDAHGMQVLSIMAGNVPNTYVGSAPDASYYLFRTEDVNSEWPIEADNWICAAEYADSAGVDIINSSLGYGYFDNTQYNLSYSQLNGSSRISRAANMAVKKGMVIINSAGNEGNKTWQYIMTPADASQVIAVGAMMADSTRAPYSSIGPTPDGRIKPDIMAMGYQTAVQSNNGDVVRGNGTSFSAPIISGLTACFWQSSPKLTSSQVIKALRENGSLAKTPNNTNGYGIANFYKMWQNNGNQLPNKWFVTPNPFNSYILIQSNASVNNATCTATLFNHQGQIITKQTFNGDTCEISQLSSLNKGIYLLLIQKGNSTQSIKLIKNTDGH